MEVKRINDSISVSPQVSVADVVAIKAAGFTAIINNRPDGEAPDQPSGEAIRAAAEATGLAYHYIPLGRDGVTPDMVAKTREVLEGSAGPVFAYCRSGTRAPTLWAVAQSGRKPAAEIISEAAGAGYDLSHLAGHLG